MEYFNCFACPQCRKNLTLEIFEFDQKKQCKEGVLTCVSCGQWYPVTNSIPRLIMPGPLRPNETSFLNKWGKKISRQNTYSQNQNDSSTEQRQIQEAFNYKWKKLPSWGIEGGSAKMMHQWLLPRYGWPNEAAYKQYIGSKMMILDAGCGLGRESLRMALANPYAYVYGLELSGCIDDAKRIADQQGVPNILFLQADLISPPFKTSIFDFIFSEGVLHHTPNTKNGFLALLPLLKMGAEIGFYIYRKKAPLREFADDYIRNQLQNVSLDTAWELMRPLTKLGKILSELKTEIDIPNDISVLGIKAGHYDIQRLVYYAIFKCYWNDMLDFEENVQINFDWYYPRFAWRHTEAEVRQWLAEAHLTITHERIEESGITIRAKK